MKEIIVKNYKDITPEINSQNGNSFEVKTIIPQSQTDKCQENVVDLAPGNYDYGDH